MLQTRTISRYCGSACVTTFRKYSISADTKENIEKKNGLESLFPDSLFNKKQRAPETFYLADDKGAQLIMKALKPHLKDIKYDTMLVSNPGIGLLTRYLLDCEKFNKFLLIESKEHFLRSLEELPPFYGDRVSVEYGDIITLWKTLYQDKQDNGTRVAELLRSVPRRKYEDDPNMMLIAASGAYSFFNHLIISLAFQNSLLSLGRPEMFLIMPPPLYIHLTCSNEVGFVIYRASSILFQIFFEYSFLTALPREYFLPKQPSYTSRKNSKSLHITSIQPDHLYLVKVVPRRNLFKLCPLEDLPALWYFIRQNCISRRNRVIPNLEKWIPGCGPRLIINREKTKKVQQLFPGDSKKKLPQFSKPCTTMSNKDYFPNMNIFTQFGDLSPSQMLTLFCQFRSWPEYSQSSFLASLESSLIKMETSADESVNGVADEDDTNRTELADLRAAVLKKMKAEVAQKFKTEKASNP